MELGLVKTPYGIFAHDPDTEVELGKLKIGTVILGEFRKVRNPLFHRKFMALVTLAFDQWAKISPPQPVNTKYGQVVPERNFDEFRYWLTIKAGFYTTVAYPDGAVRVRAKSVKFARMSEDEFEQLYSRVLDVILQEVPIDLDRHELEQTVARILHFA